MRSRTLSRQNAYAVALASALKKMSLKVPSQRSLWFF